MRNGLIVGLIGGLTAGLIGGLTAGMVGGWVVGLAVGLIVGMISGSVLGLLYGLETGIQHYTLRLVLFLDGSMPLRYVRFLDYCVDRVLLRRVGGGHMFIHRTMMEHIAALDPEKWKNESDQPLRLQS